MELKSVPRWVVWRREHKDGGKSTKVPCSPATGLPADAHDPINQLSFDAALEASGSFTGIGFVFDKEDGFCGVDLDHCLDENGEIAPWAQRYLDGLQSYAERSPSGRGIKIFLRGGLPPWAKHHKKNGLGEDKLGSVEFYDGRRFFTVTGEHWEGTPETVEDRGEELAAFYRECFPEATTGQAGPSQATPQPQPNGTPMSDKDVLTAARFSKNSSRFRALYDRGELGPYHGDASRADLALCSDLAFWCKGDPEAIDRLFRGSKLYREKWEREDYRRRTIDKALSGMRGYYGTADDAGENGSVPDDISGWIDEGSVATLADVRKALGEMKYTWKGWIQPGTMTGLAADAGTGKTLVALALCKIAWNGNPWPDDSDNPLQARSRSLWLCYDRAWPGILRAVRKMGLPDEAIILPTSRGKPLWIPDLDDPRTIPLLERIIRKYEPWTVVIDTMTYATGNNVAKAHEAKLAYSPIMGVMAETNCSCISSTHLNSEGKVLNRRPVELCRTIIKLKAPNPDQNTRLRMWVDKTDDEKPEPLGVTIGGDRLVEFDDNPPEDDGTTKTRGPTPEKSTGFAEWLFNYLEPGPALMIDIIEAARDQKLLKSPTDQIPKPSISPLYNAKSRIPRIYHGWDIHESETDSLRGKPLKTWEKYKTQPLHDHENQPPF